MRIRRVGYYDGKDIELFVTFGVYQSLVIDLAAFWT